MTTRTPCIWVAKPWPAIAAKRNYAERIQTMLHRITHDDENNWENALLSLLETYHVNVTTLDTSIPIDNYLDQAVGFQSAYSFAACSPPRSIVFCTTSLIQHYKCSWLQEAASVYGIEPNIQCIRSENVSRCLDDAKHRIVDVVLVDQDERVRAERDFSLRPLLYEYTTKVDDRYTVVAVVRGDSDVHSFADLRNRRACFPSYEGAAHIAAMQTLRNLSLTDQCAARQFFHPQSCGGGGAADGSGCDAAKYDGESGALRCLADGYGDVAIVGADTFRRLTDGEMPELKLKNVRLLCPYGQRAKHSDELCYMHWTARGHLMVHTDAPLTRTNEMYNSLRDMDLLFGKQYKSHTIPFTMFGPFDRKNNVMFRDATDGLRSLVEVQKDKVPRLMETEYGQYANANCPPLNRGGRAATVELPAVIMILFLFAFSVSY